jgi:NAD(P)H-quinone oxidoreductase subunit 5
MVHTQEAGAHRTAVALAAPFILYCLGAISGRLAALRAITCGRAWKLACLATTLALLFSLGCFAQAAFDWSTLTDKPEVATLAIIGPVHIGFRFDLVESLMLLLVSFLGWVIVHYSRAYMAGDAKESYYAGRLLQTLAAVSLLAVTNNLIVFLGAWVLTSLSLHGLLTLYPHRQAAVIAAHKKFLASRLGDLSLLGAVVLLGTKTGSFEMDKVLAYFAGSHPLSPSVHIAAFLLVMSAAIKCAQLPMHGWLIQVMEAPTPVSALLHAGVVNLGGFMLIRLAPVINSTPAAQAFLVAVGCLTAILGSLVMTTRVSIKVHLAWSTCAQMGFMLLECGAGLYGLAFLHLIAHSLYKAHAFLASGEAVDQAKVKRMSHPRTQAKLSMVIAGGFYGLLVAGAGAMLWQGPGRVHADAMLCTTIVGLAFAGVLTAAMTARAAKSPLRVAGLGFGVSALYFGYDKLFQRIVPMSAASSLHPWVLLAFPAACFVLLFAVQAVVLLWPLGRAAKSLYPWFYAGLYLDELFTRVTFHLWPVSRVASLELRRDANLCFEAEGSNR